VTVIAVNKKTQNITQKNPELLKYLQDNKFHISTTTSRQEKEMGH